MITFGERLRAALDRRGPLCVGIDPHPALLDRWGLTDTPDGLARFCRTVTGALADRVAVVKPQSAFFERYGSAGIAVLETTLRACREAGALVILDVKRGDIASTAQAYAEAYLAPGRPLQADAITASPYLGVGALAPMVDQARAHGGGVFVLAATSNPDAGQVQQARGPDGRTVAQAVVDEVARLNREAFATAAGGAGPAGTGRVGGAGRMGSLGVVVGVTAGGESPDLSGLSGPILAPGLGAQGGTPDDLGRRFGGVEPWVIPASSREMLGHGPSVTGLRNAVADAIDQCRKILHYTSS
jgi:orotidine-5'-phosphate decarboxylase